jgi:hypothetical protein
MCYITSLEKSWLYEIAKGLKQPLSSTKTMQVAGVVAQW